MTTNKNDFIYMQIYHDLQEKIKTNEIKRGEKLPTENELKDQYNVSRDSIRKALTKLENNGTIIRRAGSGTFVTSEIADYSLSYQESFTEQMIKIGKKPSSDILAIEILNDCEKDIATKLAIEPDERIYKICRVRKADGEPMALEIVFVPQKLVPNLHTFLYEETSLYQLYEDRYQLKMKDLEVHIQAELADKVVQKKLKLKENTPILKISGTMTLENHQPHYYFICYHIGTKYTFSTRLPRKKKGEF